MPRAGSPIPQARGSAPSFTSTRTPRSRPPTRWIVCARPRRRRRRYAGIPGLDQGPVRHQGPGDPRRLARAGGFRAGRGRCARGGAAARGRLCRDRPHQHDRVRLFRHRHQSALRHAEERLAPQRRPCARRLVVGRRGVDRRRHGAMARSAPTPAAPAASRRPINGIVGYKPTQRRVPLDGGVPLSFSLDSFGPLAQSVACCAALDAVLADEPRAPLQPRADQGHAARGADHGRARRSR